MKSSRLWSAALFVMPVCVGCASNSTTTSAVILPGNGIPVAATVVHTIQRPVYIEQEIVPITVVPPVTPQRPNIAAPPPPPNAWDPPVPPPPGYPPPPQD